MKKGMRIKKRDSVSVGEGMLPRESEVQVEM
jgi:hypothetical protein